MKIAKTHLGQNIARLRGMRRMTQKEMAAKLNLAQPEYSKIEQKEEIDNDLLNLIAGALEVSPEAIKHFNEDAIIHNISCTFNDHATNTMYQFSPVDQIIELYKTVIKEKDEIIKSKDELLEIYKSKLNH